MKTEQQCVSGETHPIHSLSVSLPAPATAGNFLAIKLEGISEIQENGMLTVTCTLDRPFIGVLKVSEVLPDDVRPIVTDVL